MPRWTVFIAFLLALVGTPCVADGQPLQLATLEYPPYITQLNQQPQGFVVDIVKTAFARIGQPIQIEFFPIARGQVRLLNGQADAFFSIKKTAEREQTMLFAQTPLMRQDYVFFVRKGSPWRFDGRFESLAGASVGVVSATSYGGRFDAAVQAGSFPRLEPVTTHETNFRKLIAGRVDTVICSRLVGLYYLGLLDGLDAVEVSGPVVETTQSHLAFTRQKDYTALARQFDEALERMEQDGTIRRLLDAHALPTKPSGLLRK